ncbi:hypothetical protein [Gemmobacter sp. 24YEA27]|uniref:hypothetical protein n=1 Tax=Gemmobacter sp. 24YEA27 TaxID=3040672 RepID=UPI0024B39429|nr:hypothetical protein [Gemmobacter sp. 24YEA27]
MSTAQRQAAKERLYRGWMADLKAPGEHSVLQLANRDLQRVLDRYNMARDANGGVPTVFV